MSTIRSAITQNTNIFVNVSGDDNANGLASYTAKKTLQAGADLIRSYDHNGFTMTMVVGNGIYSAGFQCVGALVGAVEFQVVGNPSSPGSVVIKVPSNEIGFFAKDYGAFTIQGITMFSEGTGAVGVCSGQFGIVDFENVFFGPMASGIHINILPFGSVNVLSGYAINGGAVAHINNQWGNIDYGGLNTNNSSVSMFNTPAWDVAGVVTSGGRTYMGNTGFGGTGGTGKRWETSSSGKIITDGNDPDSWALGNQNGQAL